MTQREQCKADQLERDNRRLTAESESLAKRLCEANERLKSQWDSVQKAMTQNLVLAQQLEQLRAKHQKAVVALKLYKAGAEVLQKAGYECPDVDD